METIQVVLDPKLLRAADRAAKRAGKSRSALIGEAFGPPLAQRDGSMMQEICAATAYAMGCDR
jgi:hypothetical protein